MQLFMFLELGLILSRWLQVGCQLIVNTSLNILEYFFLICNFKTTYLVIYLVRVQAHAPIHVWKSEDNLWEYDLEQLSNLLRPALFKQKKHFDNVSFRAVLLYAYLDYRCALVDLLFHGFQEIEIRLSGLYNKQFDQLIHLRGPLSFSCQV